MSFFRHFSDLSRLMQMPRPKRRLVFYSEGKNYWVHLEPLVRDMLAAGAEVCYISSGKDDPGLALSHPLLHVFKTDEGGFRNWLFANIDTDIMVMTMPDLHRLQVRKSRHPVHYVYVHHSLASMHMIYRKGAYDHYDTIFCAGPHHARETRATEARYGLPAKSLVEYGYHRLDAIRAGAKTGKTQDGPRHVLIAPSWGPKGMIETGLGGEIADALAGAGFRVTLRPHPQTLKFAGDEIARIRARHGGNPLFSCEDNVAGQDSLHASDAMVSDWSGAAFDYAFALGKPVIFIDVPRKVNNPDYEEIGLVPVEDAMRARLGPVLAPSGIGRLPDVLRDLPPLSCEDVMREMVYDGAKGRAAGRDFLLEKLGRA
jgi:hypothetical protein